MRSEIPKSAKAIAPMTHSKRIFTRRAAVVAMAVAISSHNAASS